MFKTHYEAEVTGLGGVRRFEGDLYVKADTPKAAKDKAESFIKNAYSETFAILEVFPLAIIE